MKFLQELLNESKKSTVGKEAKHVYHRDYVKTKNKPYRKYKPPNEKAG